MTGPTNTSTEIVFASGSEHADVGLVCHCGRLVLRFIGFRIYRDKNSISSVVCACEAGHETVVQLVDVADPDN